MKFEGEVACSKQECVFEVGQPCGDYTLLEEDSSFAHVTARGPTAAR